MLEQQSEYNIVNLRHENIEEWLQSDRHVYVGRGNAQYGLHQSKWGNPSKVTKTKDQTEAVEDYKKYLLRRSDLTKATSSLKGKVLGCWCRPDLCHAQVLHHFGNYPNYKLYQQDNS